MMKALAAAAPLAAAAGVTAALAAPAPAQDIAGTQWRMLHSPSIDSNLEDSRATRGAHVVTPPGCEGNPGQREDLAKFGIEHLAMGE